MKQQLTIVLLQVAQGLQEAGNQLVGLLVVEWNEREGFLGEMLQH